MGVLIESESAVLKSRAILTVLYHEDLAIVLLHQPGDLNLNLLNSGQSLSLTVKGVVRVIALTHSIH